MGSTSSIRVAAAAIGVVLLAGMVVGCTPATRPEGGGSQAAATTVGSSPPAPATPGGPSPTLAGRDAPPDAVLAAEGGDPATGQLGTFVWFETGSDAPWLPGAPLTVGAGEPLTVSLVPAGDVQAWMARYVPAGATGPDGATTLGAGSGDPAFAAPGPGTWTVDVFVEYAAGAGNAHYFWRLEVE